jgi:(2Fe-2S) ferredoxin
MSNSSYRVYICAGPNCTPKGSAVLRRFLEDEIARLELDDRVSVFAGGCQSHCETGPSMVVYPGPVFYQYVDKQKLQRIAREHLIGGRPVREYLHTHSQPFQKKPPVSPVRAFEQPSPETSRQNEPRKPKPKKAYDVDDFKW